MKSDVEDWLEGKGADFFQRIGLKPGDRILDFGCGSGHYSIPAAQVVGTEGRVYALDKEDGVLRRLRERGEEDHLTNLEVTESSGGLKVDLPDRSVDVVLAYDVLHYLAKRGELLDEFRRVLKIEGFLSVYPKHYRDDYPLSSFARLTLEEIIAEIERSGFSLANRFSERLVHDDSYNSGIILNFFPVRVKLSAEL